VFGPQPVPTATRSLAPGEALAWSWAGSDNAGDGAPTGSYRAVLLGAGEQVVSASTSGGGSDIPRPSEEESRYYYLAGQRIAMRRGVNGPGPAHQELYYLHTDHLGSTSEVTSESAPVARIAQERYYPYGGVRWGGAPTSYNFTGQRLDKQTGLLYYGARYYDPALMRFIQPDTLVPDPANPQSLNRYAYVLNNPLRYTDPTGHWVESIIDIISIGYDLYDISQHGLNWENGLALVADVGSLALPVVTGGGMLVRAAGHGDEALDAARGINAAVNVAQAANQADNIVDAVNAAKRLAEIGQNVPETVDLVRQIARQSTRGELVRGGVVSLGHFRAVGDTPGYIDWANKVGAAFFNMEEAVYKQLASNPELVWAVNQQFLDDAIEAGVQFHLQISPANVRAGSYFEREIQYLLERGYQLVQENGEWWLRYP